MSAFLHKALKSPGFLKRILGLKAKEDALTELNNALASTGNVRSITLDWIEQLNCKYRTDLHRKFPRELRQLYAAFLLSCLEDRQFTQEEIDDLWHLKVLFGISDSDHEGLYRSAALEVYKADLMNVLQDSNFSESEKERLEELSAYLQIPEAVRKQSFDATANDIVQKKADSLTADNQLSPTEEAEIHCLARSLGITLSYSNASAAALQKMRLLWQINNAELPPVHVDINLQRGESCYLATGANWYETRRVTRRVSYGGPSLRIKIANGLYWNTGSYGVERRTEDVLTRIDSGRVYLTTKRVLFDGALKNQSIRLQKILDVIPYKDGVQLEKDAGKCPFLELHSSQDIAIFVSILARLISDVT